MESVVNSKSSQAVSVFTPQTSSSAALSLATLAVGTHSITAKYSGDANYSTDTSAAVAVTVNPAASATAVTSSANPSYAGQSVTFTTNVTSTGPAPTGNVTFSAGSTMLGSAALSGGGCSLHDYLSHHRRHADSDGVLFRGYEYPRRPRQR